MTNDNKRKLGLFIGVFRKFYDSKTRSNKWGPDKFIRSSGTTICSVETLNAIETGELYENDEVYDLLLEKLDMKFIECTELDQSIDDYIEEFYSAVKFYNREKADSIILNIKKYPESGCAYYKQIVESMEFIVDFEFDNVAYKDLFYYLTLAKCIDSIPLTFLVAFSLFYMNLETEANAVIICKSVEIISKHNLGDELYIEVKTLCLQLNRSLFETYKLKSCCCEKHTDNNLRLYKMALYALSNETSMGNVIELQAKVHKIEEMGKSVELPKRLFIISNLEFSIIYFVNKNYDKVIECIDNVLKVEPRSICKVSPYYFNSMEQLGRPIKDLGVERISLEKNENHYYVFYRYYILKHVDQVSCNELLRYLLKRVIPALKTGIYGLQTINIMEKEVIFLAEKTRNYKSLVDFRLKVNYNYLFL